MRLLFILVLALLNTACASWPKEGRGGWAETFQRHSEGPESIWYSQSQDQLRQDMDLLALRLEVMEAKGIQQCMPAKARLAKLMEHRIRRQFVAEMFADVEQDLNVFYHQINLLQLHFDNISENTGCAKSALNNTTMLSVASQIENLLNSDNQFAFKDDKITPKYAVRIQQAAGLIQTVSGLQLMLVGHTDAMGNASANLELGLSRANQVKAALIQAGATNTPIRISTNGEFTPYSQEDSLAARLSNRRVVAFVQTSAVNASSLTEISSDLPLTQWTHHFVANQENAQ